MITKTLQEKIDATKLFIRPTIDNKSQFEANVRHTYIIDVISGYLEFILKHKNYIGQEVFKFKKKFSVTTIGDYNSDKSNHFLNPIEENSFVYTEQDYNVFCNKYLAYQIEHLTSDLVKNRHYSYSTNPLSNLESQWITESKQNLIQYLSEIKLS
jgi:hypothetical protein